VVQEPSYALAAVHFLQRVVGNRGDLVHVLTRRVHQQLSMLYLLQRQRITMRTALGRGSMVTGVSVLSHNARPWPTL
jgi:hypothetical protein